MAVHVRFQSWYISLPSSAKQQGPYACTTATARTAPSKKIVSMLKFRRYVILRSIQCVSRLSVLQICHEGVQFQIELAVVVHVLQTTHNLVISRCCFAEDGKEMYQVL